MKIHRKIFTFMTFLNEKKTKSTPEIPPQCSLKQFTSSASFNLFPSMALSLNISVMKIHRKIFIFMTFLNEKKKKRSPGVTEIPPQCSLKQFTSTASSSMASEKRCSFCERSKERKTRLMCFLCEQLVWTEHRSNEMSECQQ